MLRDAAYRLSCLLFLVFCNDFVKAYRCVVVCVNAYIVAAQMVLDVFFVIFCIVVLVTVEHKAVFTVFHVPVKNGIVHHDEDFAFIAQLFIWPDKAEDVRLEVDAVHELVVVSDNKVLFPVQLQKIFLDFFCVAAERNVAQNIDFIVIFYGFVPVFDEYLVHFFNALERTVAEIDNVFVVEMKVACYVDHLVFLSVCLLYYLLYCI